MEWHALADPLPLEHMRASHKVHTRLPRLDYENSIAPNPAKFVLTSESNLSTLQKYLLVACKNCPNFGNESQYLGRNRFDQRLLACKNCPNFGNESDFSKTRIALTKSRAGKLELETASLLRRS